MMFCAPKRKNPVDIGDTLYIVSFNIQFRIIKTKVKDIQKRKKQWELSNLIINDVQTICICENDMEVDMDDIDTGGMYARDSRWMFSTKEKYLAFIKDYIKNKITNLHNAIESYQHDLSFWKNKLKVYEK